MIKHAKLLAILAITFIAGTISSSSVSFATVSQCSNKSINSQNSVWAAICDLQDQINHIKVTPGPPGPQGPPGMSSVKFYPVIVSIDVPANTNKAFNGYCNEGDIATGFSANSINGGNLKLLSASVSTNLSSYSFEYQNINPTEEFVTVAQVICAHIGP